MRNLCFDIGNTRTKLGIFKGEKLVEKFVFPDQDFSGKLDLLTNQNGDRAIFSTTANLPAHLTDILKTRLKAIELTADSLLPFTNLYKTPQTLGKDRIAGVAGASSLFKGQNCLIIDAGTCITYDWLDASGNYLGGNIAPGLDMRLKAMHHFTAKLPLVAIHDIENPIGDSTETALRNGALWGALQEAEAYIR